MNKECTQEKKKLFCLFTPAVKNMGQHGAIRDDSETGMTNGQEEQKKTR